MLIISRKKDQKIIVADEIEITILEIGRNRVRFGVKAPKHIPIQTHIKTSPEDDGLVESIVSMGSSESAPDRHVLPTAAGLFQHR